MESEKEDANFLSETDLKLTTTAALNKRMKVHVRTNHFNSILITFSCFRNMNDCSVPD